MAVSSQSHARYPGLYLQALQGVAGADAGNLAASVADLGQLFCHTSTHSPPPSFIAVSSFLLDPDAFFELLPDLRTSPDGVILLGRTQVSAAAEYVAAHKLSYRVLGPATTGAGTHHTKFIFAFYPDRARLCITTSNFRRQDVASKTQALWWQDFPLLKCHSTVGEGTAASSSSIDGASVEQPVTVSHRGSSVEPESIHPQPAPRGSVPDFGAYLLRYLRSVHENSGKTVATQRLLDHVRRYSYADASVALVGSVPGAFAGPQLHDWGHMRVRHCLRSEALWAAERTRQPQGPTAPATDVDDTPTSSGPFAGVRGSAASASPSPVSKRQRVAEDGVSSEARVCTGTLDSGHFQLEAKGSDGSSGHSAAGETSRPESRPRRWLRQAVYDYGCLHGTDLVMQFTSCSGINPEWFQSQILPSFGDRPPRYPAAAAGAQLARGSSEGNGAAGHAAMAVPSTGVGSKRSWAAASAAAIGADTAAQAARERGPAQRVQMVLPSMQQVRRGVCASVSDMCRVPGWRMAAVTWLSARSGRALAVAAGAPHSFPPTRCECAHTLRVRCFTLTGNVPLLPLALLALTPPCCRLEIAWRDGLGAIACL